jgi:hypothetical protein
MHFLSNIILKKKTWELCDAQHISSRFLRRSGKLATTERGFLGRSPQSDSNRTARRFTESVKAGKGLKAC